MPTETPPATIGVAATTPGSARSASPVAQSGIAAASGTLSRTSAPAAKAAWSAWLVVHVAACADAKVPSAAASTSSSAARV